MTKKQQLVVFSDDWGRHPSSCQHLVSRLLDDFEVTWVNTIGTRPPSLNFATVHRGLEKLSQWQFSSTGRRGANLHSPRVLNPVMWPRFAASWEQRINRELLVRHLARHLPRRHSPLVMTTIPVVADLVGQLPGARWVYYCVDDFGQWPGLDGRTLRRMEARLAEAVDEVVAAGDNLARRMKKLGRQALVVSHGVDLAHWRQNAGDFGSWNVLDGLERPFALFWGLIDRRLDIDWLRALSTAMDAGTIVLVGPQQDPDAALANVPRVRCIGPVSYAELPRAAAAADVLIMPYADLPVTRAMQPLKLKEYLATNKPVVGRRLPATEGWEQALWAVDDARAFSAAVLRSFREGLSPVHMQARQRLKSEGWPEKAQTLRELLNSLAS